MHLYSQLSLLTIILPSLAFSLAVPCFHQKQKPRASPLLRVIDSITSYTIMSTSVDLMVWLVTTSSFRRWDYGSRIDFHKAWARVGLKYLF